MKKVLVLGGSYLQSDFIQTALNKKFKVYVLDRNKYCYAAQMEGVEFHNVDISNEKEVEKFFVDYKCDLIISPVTEIGNRVAANIAAKQEILYNSVDAVKATTDKWLMRNALKESSLSEPKSERFSSVSEVKKNFRFPLIVKPPISSASRGVTLVRDETKLEEALNEALKFTSHKNDILIEEFIDGAQYSIETISNNGDHFIVGIAREYISGPPWFVERTVVISPDENEVLYGKLLFYIRVLLNQLGITVGPCHIEVKIRDGEVYLIEAASRSGLLRDQLLKTANCSNYNELILKAYCNERIKQSDIEFPGNSALLGVMMYPEDLNNYLKAKKNNHLVREYFNGSGPVVQPKRLTDAFGYFFAAGEEEILNYKLTV